MKDAPQGQALRRRRILFWSMAVAWLVADLASKEAIFAWLAAPSEAAPGGPYGERQIWVLDGLLRLSAYVNPGAAFGMGGGSPWLVFAVAGLLLPVLVWLAYSARERGAPLWALGATVGGAVGNLHDRLRLSGVRDFLELVKPWSPDEMLWPVFNVADMGIVGGVMIFFAWSIWRRQPPGGAVEDGGPKPGQEASS